jgi:hypothetical protein
VDLDVYGRETVMREWESLSHVRWYCRYHVVFVPKYRKKVIFGQLRKGIGAILRQLCDQEGIELVEGIRSTTTVADEAARVT